jgi:hypothetical protein
LAEARLALLGLSAGRRTLTEARLAEGGLRLALPGFPARWRALAVGRLGLALLRLPAGRCALAERGLAVGRLRLALPGFPAGRRALAVGRLGLALLRLPAGRRALTEARLAEGGLGRAWLGLAWLGLAWLGLAVSGRAEARCPWRSLAALRGCPDRVSVATRVRRELAEGEGSGTGGRKRGVGRIPAYVREDLALTGEQWLLGARARGGGGR